MNCGETVGVIVLVVSHALLWIGGFLTGKGLS